MQFETALAAAQIAVADQVNQAIGSVTGELAAAMRYAVTGGKGLRGFLVLESARLHGISAANASPAAAAIECLHAYSLVHDDLPCMDNDDLRRGQPTVHRKWDDATAVLAGDALQSLAFELCAATKVPDQARLALLVSLSRSAGLRGMIGGQAADIAAETSASPLTLAQITALQAGKTGALMTWSATAGAHMADADPTALKTYGDCLGLAFQITDDILDVTGNAMAIGKAVRKDANAGKATFVSLLGLDDAKRRAAALTDQACAALSVYGETAETLRQAAHFVITRQK